MQVLNIRGLSAALIMLAAVLTILAATACGDPAHKSKRVATTRSASELVRRLDYQIHFNKSLEFVTVEACSDQHQTAWVSGAPNTLPEVSVERIDKDGARCVRVRLRLEDRGPRASVRRPEGLSVSTAALLYRPRSLSSKVRVSVRLEFPAEYDVLAPWPGSAPNYKTDIRALRFDGLLSLSKAKPLVFREAGVEIKAHLFSGPFEPAEAWIRHSVRTIEQLWGVLPFERLHVVVMPVQTGGAVRFGFATRGPVGTVLVMPNKKASAAELQADWVLPHELTHLLFPYIEDAWLSEGLATYYQEVLRARVGTIDAKTAWSRLASGFARGERASGDTELEQLSETMRQTGAYIRVYWSGAALAFLLDVSLRRKGTSLDQALQEAFSQQHYGDVLTAKQVLRWLDEGRAGGRAQRLCSKWLSKKEFPPALELLSSLQSQPRSRRESNIVGESNIANAIMNSVVMTP